MSDYMSDNLKKALSKAVGRGLNEEYTDILNTFKKHPACSEYVEYINASLLLALPAPRQKRHLGLINIMIKTSYYESRKLWRAIFINIVLGLAESGKNYNDYIKLAGITNTKLFLEKAMSQSRDD